MRWVRTNRRFGAGCAFAAIMLQIILSFGHVHRVVGFPAGTPALQADAAIPVLTTVEPAAPASKAPGPTFQYCAICAVLMMGATAVPPEAPDSQVPALTGRVRFVPRAEVATWTLAHQFFQARAPPAV